MKSMHYKQFQTMQQVLIYDLQSQNNEQLTPTNDEPEPAPPVAKMEESSATLITTTIHVRSNQSQESPPKIEQIPKVQKQRKKSQNIIFFEEEIRRSEVSVDYDQTNRGFLKKNMPSSQQEYESDEEEELEQLKEEQEEETQPSSKRKIVPKQETLPNKQILVQTNTDMVMYQAVPPNYKVTCYVSIQRGLLGFAQTYRLFLGKEKQFLMSAKKENFKYYSNFIISNHPHQIHKRSEIWIGRLQSNFMGTQFKYYSVQDKFEMLKLQVNYHKNFVGFMGPRSFSAVKVDPKAKKGKYLNSLASILERNERSKLIEMTTAQPTLIRGKYRLDFGGKVRVPSSKNFILKQGQMQSLLFGKVAKDTYIMQVSYPLSPFEAFGLCLTSLDSKLMVS